MLATSRETRPKGNPRMPARFACLRALLLIAAVFFTVILPTVVVGQQPEQTPAAAIDTVKAELDQTEATLRREGLRGPALGELRDRLTEARDRLRQQAEALEPQLGDLDARIKQLGDKPAAGAPPEDPAIAAERDRLSRQHGEVDTALKQVRLLSLRADQLSERVIDRRRANFAQRLFARSASVLDLSFWREVADAIPREARSIGFLAQSSASYAYQNGGPSGILAAIATLVALAIAATVFVRWWRRRALTPPATDTRFSKALAALISLAQVSVTAPLCTLAVLLVFDNYGLLAPRLWEIGTNLVFAVGMASFGHGVAAGLFAPHEPARRLLPIDDESARRLAVHLKWGARGLGLAVLLNAIHRALFAPVALTVATSALLALFVAALVATGLLRIRETRADGTSDVGPRAQWLRAAAWLVITAILISLVLGHIGFAAFLAGRLLTIAAVLGALYICLVFVDALFTEVLTTDTPRVRAVAAVFGLGPRGVELIGTLLSAAIRILLVLVAIVPILGRSGVVAADLWGTVQGAVFGFRIGAITISLSAILGAVTILLIGILLTRALQRWLQTRFLPRTGLEPSLQLSVSTIIGYVGFIAVLTFALTALGIDLQKVALIAGALSVGIGFGLQSIVSNFVSGLILLAERPIRVGDQIIVKGEEGHVRRISVRATEIETVDRASVIVPNSELITGVVKNLTHTNMMGRVVIKVGVAYDSDPERVRDILLACARAHPLVLQTPEPAVLLAAFGDDALQFEMYCGIANLTRSGSVKSDLHFEILKRFRAAGIVIPFPQREIRLLGETAAPETARPEPGRPEPGRPEPAGPKG
jgi:potassium-dependent mechanosensitive channel